MAATTRICALLLLVSGSHLAWGQSVGSPACVEAARDFFDNIQLVPQLYQNQCLPPAVNYSSVQNAAGETGVCVTGGDDPCPCLRGLRRLRGLLKGVEEGCGIASARQILDSAMAVVGNIPSASDLRENERFCSSATPTTTQYLRHKLKTRPKKPKV
eukprot:jgi/Mesvir1/27838/Mv07515-RA.1